MLVVLGVNSVTLAHDRMIEEMSVISLMSYDVDNDEKGSESTAWITETKSGEKNGVPGVFVSYKVRNSDRYVYDVTVKICVVGNEIRKLLNLEPCITDSCSLYNGVGTGTVFFPCNNSQLSMELQRCGMSDFSIEVM